MKKGDKVQIEQARGLGTPFIFKGEIILIDRADIVWVSDGKNRFAAPVADIKKL